MKHLVFLFILFIMTGCKSSQETAKAPAIKLITLDPGHFHAALIQKTMYDDVDSVVHIYAPAGPDLNMHQARIDAYNKRTENPTRWHPQVYTGDDFMEKMLAEKKGNVVVMAGNNRKKTEYILSAVRNGFHVLADKPMAIDKKNFELLKTAFEEAEKKQSAVIRYHD